MRVYVMHAGMPMVDEIIMLMYAHPQVFVDISADNWGVPRAEFDGILKRMVQAGYGRRIMFGSDQMVWPGAIPIAIASITEATYLTSQQEARHFTTTRHFCVDSATNRKTSRPLMAAFHPLRP